MKPRLVSFFSAAAIAILGLEAIPAAESPLGYRIAYGTYLGGTQWDQAREIIVHPDGSVLVGMQSCSIGLPTTSGAIQPQYAGDDPALGHGGVYGGDCYLARLTSSRDFPVTDGAVQSKPAGKGDAFILKLAPVFGQR